MITIRRSAERQHDRRRRQEVWNTFSSQSVGDALGAGFGSLERLNEDRLPPGASFSRVPQQQGELLTYVREGALSYEDSLGCSGIIHAGEFQRLTLQSRVRHSETNPSRSDWAHAFQIWLRPTEPGLQPDREQRRFSAAQRRGSLCVIASPDGRRGSLRIHQDALLYSAILAPGKHVVHELAAERGIWLHVVQGRVSLGGCVLATGDGAGMTGERVLSLTASEDSEILVLDVRGAQLTLAPPLEDLLHPDGVLQDGGVVQVQAA